MRQDTQNPVDPKGALWVSFHAIFLPKLINSSMSLGTLLFTLRHSHNEIRRGQPQTLPEKKIHLKTKEDLHKVDAVSFFYFVFKMSLHAEAFKVNNQTPEYKK